MGFRITYTCAPEDRNIAVRKRLYNSYGRWSSAFSEKDVQWWSSLTEAPEDVVEFLEFLTGNFDDVQNPFRIIDGPDGNGGVTLREFEEGVKALHCRKFEGPDEVTRISTIFRFLD